MHTARARRDQGSSSASTGSSKSHDELSQELKDIVPILEVNWKKEDDSRNHWRLWKLVQGRNPDRVSTLKLLHQLRSSREITNAEFIGALCFALWKIALVEYEGKDPTKKKGWIWNEGSDFYTYLQYELIGRIGRPLDPFEHINCIQNFFNFVERQKTNRILLQSQKWHNLEELKIEINHVLQAVSLKQLAVLEDLINPPSELLAAYKIAGGNNPTRTLEAYFGDVIFHLCDLLYPVNDLLIDGIYSDKALAFHGALLYLTLEINSPRSILFNLCLKALHVESLSEITQDRQIACLSGLERCLRMIQNRKLLNNEDLSRLLQEKNLMGDEFLQLNNFIKAALKDIPQKIKNVVRGKHIPRTIKDRARKSFVGLAKETGNAVVCEVSNHATPLLVGGAITLGAATGGLPGAAVGAAAPYAFNYVLRFFYGTLGKKAYHGAARYLFPSKEKEMELQSMLTILPKNQMDFFLKWINALSNVRGLPAEKQDHLRYFLDLLNQVNKEQLEKVALSSKQTASENLRTEGLEETEESASPLNPRRRGSGC